MPAILRSPFEIVLELVSAGGRADPYEAYRELHSFGEAVRVAPNLVIVTGYDAASVVLRDPTLVEEGAEYADRILPGWRDHRSRVVLNRSMLFVDGHEHRAMRRLAAGAFTAHRTAALRSTVTRAVTGLLDRLAARMADHPVVDFMTEFALELPVAVICGILGVPLEHRAIVREPAAAVARALEPGWATADLTEADAAAATLETHFLELLRQRRSRPQDDLISAMIDQNARSGEPLSDHHLAANCVLLLLAGFETTTSLLGSAIAQLCQQPDVRLGASQDEAAGFVEEVLRVHSPVQFCGRIATRDGANIGAVELRTDDSVLVLIGAANRDPRRFAEPDRFVPDRTDNQPLSFGAGVHRCLGAHLARLEAQLALPMFWRRFPNVALAGDPVRLERVNLRGFASLPISLG